MSDCPHSHDDGAYVLGALSPSERAAFERHLTGCDACRDAVAEVAALPGLLGRLEAAELASVGSEYLPESPLPDLIDAVQGARRRERRRARRRVVLAVAAAVCLALAGGFAATWLGSAPANPVTQATSPTAGATSPTTAPSTTAPSTTASAPPITEAPASMVAMKPARPTVRVRAEVGLRNTAWGTEVFVHCWYPATTEYSRPYEYRLMVRGPNRATEQIGSWNAGPGDDVRLTGFTRFPAAYLERIELVGRSGTALLSYDVP